MSSDLMRGNTPALVLAVLREGPAHGYTIASRIDERADRPLHLKHGTLYPVLHGLERDGWVVAEWQHPEGERPRKVYAITDAGRAELIRHIAEWRQFSRTIDEVLGVGLEPG